jgi:segregation and condensation protein A
MLQTNSGIELLVNTVRDGEMDPRDLDIISLTDSYLEKIDTMDHRNLTISGRLFFYASVLLRLKAEFTAKGFIQIKKDFANDDEEEFFNEYDEIYELEEEGVDIFESGEQLTLPGMFMTPKASPERERGLSLFDLIGALQRCESAERRRENSRKISLRTSALHMQALETAHSDDLAGDMLKMRSIFGFENQEDDYRVSFHELLTEHLSPTTAYMALLFLASNSEIELHQRNFYRDLTVSRGREFTYEELDG